MKRIISLSLAIMLIFSCMFLLTGCIPEDGPGVNEGYKSFNNGGISFDYPETWMNVPFIESFTGLNMIMDLEGSGSNINVQSKPRSDDYMAIPDADGFMELMGPELEAQGLNVENPEMQKGTTNGLDYVLLSFDSMMSDVPMHQTIIFTSAGEYTYIIALTEMEENSAHLDALLSSLSPTN